MDPQRFDALSRVLASGTSRRLVLTGLTGGLLARLPLTGGSEEAQAKHKKKKKKPSPSPVVPPSPSRPPVPPSPPPPGPCIPNCAGHVCGDDGCGGGCGVACASPRICQGGACVCPSGQHDCQGACIPTSRCCSDDDCAGTQGCFSGTCITLQGTCSPGADLCVNDPNSSGFRCGGGHCTCYTTMGFQTRCGSDEVTGCNTCTSDAQCAALHPEIPGIFCQQETGQTCLCGGRCISPCPD